MKNRILFIAVILLSSITGSALAETADVRINNPRVEGGYYKFELQIKRTDAWDVGLDDGGLGDCDWYFAYNSAAFGSNVPSYENLNSTIATNNADGNVDYVFIVQKTGGELQIKCSLQDGDAGEGSTADDLFDPTLNTWITLLTVTWQIDNTGESSGITWNQVNTGMQDGDNDEVTVGSYEGNGDISLPVQMSDITAVFVEGQGVTLTWQTASEVNTLGFYVLRSREADGNYTRITNALIPGQGNSSSGAEYEFTDSEAESGIDYWYKIEEISTDGSSDFYGPILVPAQAMLPGDFALSQNYPNPFNPVTHFKYQLPRDCQVNIVVYSLLGQEVKVILQGKQSAGFYTADWDSRDAVGRAVPSGIYFLRMQADGITEIRKMTLMR